MEKIDLTEETKLRVENTPAVNYCWYCGKPIFDDKANAEVAIYHVEGRSQTGVSYTAGTLNVPRCKDCQAIHEKGVSAFSWFLIIFFIAWIGATIWGFIMDNSGILSGGAILLIGFPVMGLLFFIRQRVEKRRAKNAGIKHKEDLKGFEPFDYYSAKGWTLKEPTAYDFN